MKVWFKRLPGDPTVSVSVMVPYGSDQDPPGKEQLAHFTEHMLFSDQPNRTEQEIKREVDQRGGVYNGYTAWDRTFYFVRIGKEHGQFAVDWIYRIVSPHAMDPQVVDRQREPVALEVRARPRELFDWVLAYYLDPPWLRTPDFWKREFGLETTAARDVYFRRSLYRIQPEDLRWFYNTYYVPSKMTLTVVGDLDRDAVLNTIQKTFAGLPARTVPSVPDTLRDPNRFHRTFSWVTRPNVYYSLSFKFYHPSREQHLMLIFLSRFLSKRINDKLRFGDRKAAYGIWVGVTRRGSSAQLSVGGNIKASEFEYARGLIEREIDQLRSGSLPAAEFEADRAAEARQLRVTNAAAKDLEDWVWVAFYDPQRYRDFPDLVAFFENVSQAEVSKFVREQLVLQRQVLGIVYPHPMTQGVQVCLALISLCMIVALARRWLTRPVEMSRIRYVARFQLSLPFKVVVGTMYFLLVAVGARLWAFGWQFLIERFVFPISSFWAQWSIFFVLAAITVLLLIRVFASIPRKLLLFDDRLVIKYLSYRSEAALPADVVEISQYRFPAVWLSRRLWKCVPLTLGILSPGIYLRLSNGWAYFFAARDSEELVRLLRGFAAPGQPG